MTLSKSSISVAAAILLAVSCQAAPLMFTFAEASGSIPGTNALALYPTGFPQPDCFQTDPGVVTCTGENWVAAGTYTAVLLENAGGSLSDPTTWSDLLVITPGLAKLYSGPADLAAAAFAIYGGPLAVMCPTCPTIVETDPVTSWDLDTQYGINVYSGSEVPEPATFLLLGSSLVLVRFVSRRRKFRG